MQVALEERKEFYRPSAELEGRNLTDQVLCVQVGATAEELR